MSRSVKPFQPRFGVSQPQTFLKQNVGCPMYRKARAVVSNLNTKCSIPLFRFNFDAAGTNYGRVALGLPSENLTL